MSSTTPFVNFKMHPTLKVGSTPTIILGSDQYTCLIDGIVLANLTPNAIIITVYVAREIIEGKESNIVFANHVSIQANDRVDLLLNCSLTLQPGDLLYAFSNYSNNIFNTFVSYRELVQTLTPTP
jgi:hypothetical protein